MVGVTEPRRPAGASSCASRASSLSSGNPVALSDGNFLDTCSTPELSRCLAPDASGWRRMQTGRDDAPTIDYTALLLGASLNAVREPTELGSKSAPSASWIQ